MPRSFGVWPSELPALDVPPTGQMHGDDPSIKVAPQTAQLAVELPLSALGKTILPP